MYLFLLSLVTFLSTFFILYLARIIFPKLGLLDRPWLYGLDRAPIPYPVGFLLYFIFVFLVLYFVPLDVRLLSVLLAAGILVLVSFLDDRFSMSPLWRLLVQCICVSVVILGGVGIEGIKNPLGGFISLNQYRNTFIISGHVFEIVWLADILVLFWIVVLINTMNWLDGLPGLSSGVGAIGFTVLLGLSLVPGHVIDQTQVVYLSLIMAVLSFTFWLFDFSPPKMLLGDSGSMFFGFMLAILSIFSGAKMATTFLILGLPIFDVIWVILRRIFIEKRSPLKGDMRHFHHRLIKAGFTERQSLGVIYAVCFLFGAIALFLNSFAKMIAIVFLVLFGCVLAIYVMKREALHKAD